MGMIWILQSVYSLELDNNNLILIILFGYSFSFRKCFVTKFFNTGKFHFNVTHLPNKKNMYEDHIHWSMVIYR